MSSTSPTPFWYYSTIPFFTGVSTSGQTSGGCSSYYTEFSSTTVTTSGTTFVSDIPLATSYGAWPSYEGGAGQEANIDIQGPVVVPYTGDLAEWLCENCGTGDSPGDSYVYFSDMLHVLADTPYFVSQFPQVGSCRPISAGEGAPTVHIPVSELVATTTSVTRRSGIYTGTSSTSIDTASAEVLTPAPSLQPTFSISPASTAEVLTPALGLTTSTSASTTYTGSQSVLTAEVLTPASRIETTSSVETTQVSSAPPTAFPPHLGVSESSLDTPPTSEIETVASSTTIPNALPENSGSDSTPPPTTDNTGGATPSAQPDTSAQDSNPPSTANGAGGATEPAAITTTPSTSPISWVSTIAIQPSSSVAESQSVLPVLTFDSITASPDSSSQYDIGGGQTLSPNGPAVTNAGNTYSLSIGASATAIISNGVTSVIAAPSSVATEVVAVPAPVVTIGSAVVTQNSASQYVIPSSVAGGSSDQTLVPGDSAIVASGTTYSIPSAGTAILVNGQTSNIATPAGAIVTFGPGPGSTAGSGVLTTPVASGGAYIIAGHTVTAGGSAVVVSGTTYSIPSAGSAVVVNGQTSALATPVAAIVTLASGSGDISEAVIATPIGNSAYVVAGQTLSPGGSVIIDGGTTYSLASSAGVGSGGGAIVINGITSSLPAVTVAAGVPATSVGSSGEYIIAGQTLIPGGSAILAAGTTYSLVSGTNGVIVVNGVTSTFSATAAIADANTGVLATPIGSSGEFVIEGQTLGPDGSAIVVSGTTYSLARSTAGSSEVVVVNGVTSPLPTAAATAAAAASAETEYILDGQTLIPGASAITISGTTISLAAAGSTVYINGIASALPTPTGSGSDGVEIAGLEATPTLLPSAQTAAVQGEIIVDGTTYPLTQRVVSGTTELVIGSQTLSPNAIITVGDATLSLAPGGTGVLVAEGGGTETSAGVAGAIMSVLEAGDLATATGTVTVDGMVDGTVTVVKTSTSTTKTGTGNQLTTSPSTSAVLLSTTGPPSEGTKTSSSKGAAVAGGIGVERGRLGHGVVGGLISLALGFVAFL